MDFLCYDDISKFRREVLGVLLENEAQNNLMISIIENASHPSPSDWLLAAVTGSSGKILLTAMCTPPFGILLYETENRVCDGTVELLAGELKRAGYMPSGVLAQRNLAARFATAYRGKGGFCKRMSMNVMCLDNVRGVKRAPGKCRFLRESDMSFAPYWERAFSEDCGVEVFSIAENAARLNTRLGKNTHFIWENRTPVSQAVHGRSTVNGAVVNGVYTPPHYRGKGYASSVVAELSQTLLDRGNKFCCLFADANNPVSCGIYRKIGYQDISVFDELKFL